MDVHAGNVQYYVLIFVSTLLNQSVQNLSYKNVCGWLNKWSGIVFSVLLFSIFIYTFCFAVSYSVSFLFTRVQNQNKVCFCFLIFFFAWRRWSFNFIIILFHVWELCKNHRLHTFSALVVLCEAVSETIANECSAPVEYVSTFGQYLLLLQETFDYMVTYLMCPGMRKSSPYFWCRVGFSPRLIWKFISFRLLWYGHHMHVCVLCGSKVLLWKRGTLA